MTKNKRYLLISLILSVILMFISGCDLFIKTNDGYADLWWYMGLTYENEAEEDVAFTTNIADAQMAAVALENEYSTLPGIIVGEEAYINIETVKEYIDIRFHYDSANELALFTDATNVYEIPSGSTAISGEEVGYTAVLNDETNAYINLKAIAKFVDYSYEVFSASEDVPPVISIDYSTRDKTIATVKSKIELRTKGNYQNLIVTTLAKSEKITIIEKGDNWTKVKNETGYIGYVPTKKIKNEEEVPVEYVRDYSGYTHISMGEKVCMVWNQVYNQTANGNFDDLTENVNGANVISPTWFSVVDKNGNLSSLADLEYVEKSHDMGMQVWPIVNDFTNPEVTAKVMADAVSRQKLVNNIMYFINAYDLDGINVDFEYVTLEGIDNHLQFLRELSVQCRKAGKILSIDNYVPTEWTEYYNREHQALLADYMIVMNYDEHTAGSDVAGSVASIDFARKGIEDTISATGDASRVISGIPFYTRVWKETPENVSDGEGVYVEDAVNGNYYLTSQAVGMNTAKDLYVEEGATPVYDETTGQNFVSYITKGDVLNKIWLEDETSIRNRLNLMNEYEIGGVAFWALGQESDSMWNVIHEYFK